MKKLIFLFAFIMLATTGAWAQSATQPEAGGTYTYLINEGTGTFTWWVTTNPNDLIADASSTDRVKSDAGIFTIDNLASFTENGNKNEWNGTDANSIQLTWSAASVAANTTYYLMVKKSDGSCSNIKGWAITPTNNFGVTLAAVGDDGTTANYAAKCPGDIASAKFVSGAFEYDYGTVDLYYEATATNISSAWTPTIQVSGLNTGETIGSASFAADIANLTAASPSPDGTFSSSDNFATLANTSTTGTMPTGGTTIYIKVTVDHNTAERLAAGDITLTIRAVDGAGNAANTVSGTTTDATAVFGIKARPTMTVNP
jgi:hypothetical protein